MSSYSVEDLTYNNVCNISEAWAGFDGNTITTSTISNSTTRVDGSLMVNGRDVMRELDEMRDVLLLLKRDIDMESKYPRLKEIKQQYEAALEKYKTFEALK